MEVGGTPDGPAGTDGKRTPDPGPPPVGPTRRRTVGTVGQKRG